MARSIKQIILFFALTIICTNLAKAKIPPPGTGSANIPANIMLMLDNSGSMGNYLQSGVVIYNPYSSAIDSSGNLYVWEYSYQRIKVFNNSGTYLRTIQRQRYGSACYVSMAYNITIHNNLIYIADFYGRKIVVFRTNGSCVRSYYTNYTYPYGIAVTNNNVFVAHYSRIDTYTSISSGMRYLRNYRHYTTASGRGISVNTAGTKLVSANYYSHTVTEFNINNGILSFSKFIGPTSASSRDGYHYRPWSVAIDTNGNYYVTYEFNHKIQKFNSSGVYQAKTGSYSTSSPFYNTRGVTIDSANNIFVADQGNYTIRKFDSSLNLVNSIGGRGITLMQAAKNVIKKIVSNTELTKGANFGLTKWSYDYYSWRPENEIMVPINNQGAQKIAYVVDSVQATGFSTYLERPLSIVQNYFNNGAYIRREGKNYPSPINRTASCQQNFAIVISDGSWFDPSQALRRVQSMKNQNPPIKTIVIGFAYGGSKTNYYNLAKAGCAFGKEPDCNESLPLFADNEAELLTSLTDAIKQIISSSLTFSNPAVVSEINKGDYVYQATFEYEPKKQWTGHLKKFQIDTNNNKFSNPVWDAADKLNSKSYSSRQIWTVGAGLSGLNNFTTSNLTFLKSQLYPGRNPPSDNNVTKLINFVRGLDSYDTDKDGSTTDSRHKLADIYNSSPVVVGPPDQATTSSNNYQEGYYRSINNYESFKSKNQSRKEIILAGSNGGMLHAFDTSNGDELWAFIPPSMLGNLSKMVSNTPNTTNAIYGVDGSPIVKDIFYDDTPNDGKVNPVWKTIALFGMGAGGNSYSALDITNPISPKHLFTIENNPFTQFVHFWDEDGNLDSFPYSDGTIDLDHDYRKLGESWSTPRIIRIKTGTVNGSAVYKWVAVFGAGYNGQSNPNYGSGVYVMDLENKGKVLKYLEIQDKVNVYANYYITTPNNNSLSSFNLINYGLASYDTSRYKLRVLGTNINYNITGTMSGNTYSNLQLSFDVPPPSNSRITVQVVDDDEIVNSVPSDITLITADTSDKASFDGAMAYVTDMEGKVTKVNLTSQGTLYQSTILFDAESTNDNGRLIFQSADATMNQDNNLWLYFGTGNTERLEDKNANIKNRLYGIKDKDFPEFKSISSPGKIANCKGPGTGCPTQSDLGWYYELPNSQKLTAQPTIQGDVVYFPLYEPTTTGNSCSNGKAILSYPNSICGNANYKEQKLGSGVLSKVTKANNKIIIGLSGEADKNTGFNSQGNLLIGDQKGQEMIKGIQVESWRQN